MTDDEEVIRKSEAEDDEDDGVVTHPPLELARADEIPDDLE